MIIVSAVPIALTANITRVLLTGYIMHFCNPEFAAGDVPHGRGTAHDGVRPAAAQPANAGCSISSAADAKVAGEAAAQGHAARLLVSEPWRSTGRMAIE